MSGPEEGRGEGGVQSRWDLAPSTCPLDSRADSVGSCLSHVTPPAGSAARSVLHCREDALGPPLAPWTTVTQLKYNPLTPLWGDARDAVPVSRARPAPGSQRKEGWLHRCHGGHSASAPPQVSSPHPGRETSRV